MVLTGLSIFIAFSTEGLEDVGAIMGEAVPGLGCSFSTRRISWVTVDELQEEDH